MAHYDFDKDLQDGLKAENEVKLRLLAYFSTYEDDIERCSTKEYDLKIMSQGLTFEVKNDLMAEKTGNIAIEYHSRGKDSGIAITTANYWVYKFAEMYYLIDTARLKSELLEHKNYTREVTGGDAGSNTKMYLVKVSTFKTWGIRI